MRLEASFLRQDCFELFCLSEPEAGLELLLEKCPERAGTKAETARSVIAHG